MGTPAGGAAAPAPAPVLTELFDMSGTTALVTGAASGLGRAFAEVLVGVGAHVVAADLDERRLERAGKELAEAAEAGGSIECVTLDVRQADAVDAVFDDVVARTGRLDAVFANAGIALGKGPGEPAGYLENFDLGGWATLLDVNLNGVLHTIRAAARHMKPRGSGSIVLTASTAGLRVDPLVPYSYVAAKAAVVNLTHQAAIDLARWGVRVNAIAPGPFRTSIGGEGPMDRAAEEMWSSMTAMRRIGDPREIRGLALLLASRAGSYLTGGVYVIDGGQTLQAPALRLDGPAAP
ncbi:MAG: SDR family oxidoreductase [Frankia sp.]|nr:SDR family oxidoreductase [Frankia sp.]